MSSVIAFTADRDADEGSDFSDRERVRAILPERDRTLLLARRQCLLIELGALEVYLGLDRSVIPKHARAEDSRRHNAP